MLEKINVRGVLYVQHPFWGWLMLGAWGWQPTMDPR